jgi:hypothetical protein
VWLVSTGYYQFPVELDRDERHLQIELTVSAIQKEMAMIHWRNARSAGSSKARYIGAREYAKQ